MQQRETRTVVRHCIDRLPDTYRTVLLLRDIEDLKTEVVAAALGITPNAVKIRLHFSLGRENKDRPRRYYVVRTGHTGSL